MTPADGRFPEVVDVCVRGSINIDVAAYTKRLPEPGETVQGTRWCLRGGGKGANQAVAAARLGASVKLIGKRGNDALGQQALETLSRVGVDVSAVEVASTPTGLAAIMIADDGENVIVSVPGSNAEIGSLPADVEAKVWLTQAEVPLMVVEQTLRDARRTGGLALINPSPAGLLPSALIAQFDVAIVNEHELEALDGEWPKVTVVTKGAKGAVILPEGTELPAYPSEPVDTTGAGDVFAGALAAYLARHEELEAAVRYGMAAAALYIRTPGGQEAMPSHDEVVAFSAAHARQLDGAGGR